MRFLGFIIFFCLLIGFAKVNFSQTGIWTRGTAKTIPAKDYQLALIEPSIYGLSDYLELSCQPLAFFIAPNAGLKYNWYYRRIIVSSYHGMYYPTIALKQLSKHDWLDGLNENSAIPQILAFRNELLISREIGGKKCSAFVEPGTPDPKLKLILTLKLGLQMALNNADSEFVAIDEPVLFQRSSTYNGKYLWNLGFDVDGKLYKNINFSADIDLFTTGFDYFDIEHKAMLIYKYKKHFAFLGGYKFTFASYPDGNRFSVFPVFDILYYFDTPNFKDGLFKK